MAPINSVIQKSVMRNHTVVLGAYNTLPKDQSPHSSLEEKSPNITNIKIYFINRIRRFMILLMDFSEDSNVPLKMKNNGT